MQSDQNQLVGNSLSSRKNIKSRNSVKRAMSRVQKIKDKRMIFPESTVTKLVFVSNMQGNGFRRQNIFLSDVPAHINLQTMINQINHACFQQWRDSMIAIESQPLSAYDLFQTILGLSTFIIIIAFIAFITLGEVGNTELLAYIFILVGNFSLYLSVLIGCLCSIFLIKEKRVDINRDLDMIRAIKKELIKLNQQQMGEFSQSNQFTWTCHKDCLWIACQIH